MIIDPAKATVEAVFFMCTTGTERVYIRLNSNFQKQLNQEIKEKVLNIWLEGYAGHPG